ncbi:MAG: hypothetical protein GY794_23685 [bacterium]|nr:hypothetical protein [bacterium]
MDQQGPKLEGTFVLEGLIEGTLPDESLVSKLRAWEHQVRNAKLPLTVQVDSGRFNVLPEMRAGKVVSLSGSLRDVIVPLLEQLMEIIPPGWRVGMVSTLRSREYLTNEEEQTLYVFDQTGMILVEQRRVDVQTLKPTPPLTTREKIMIGVSSVGVLCIILVILMYFFDMKSWFQEARDSLVPYNAGEIRLDAEPFESWMDIKHKTLASGKDLTLEFTPTGEWPATWESLNALHDKAGTLREKLALQSIGRGRISYRLFDRNDKLITFGQAIIMLKPLKEKADEVHLFTEHLKDFSIVLHITLSTHRRVVRVELLP